MTPAGKGPVVVDRPSESRFVIEDHGALAELVYRLEGDRLVLVHTGVPDELGGRGIGGRLVAAAAELAGREHLTLVPWCPFARRWLRRHPETASGVEVDWDSLPADS